MCGIVGFLSPDGIPDERSALGVLTAMRDRLIHRGPDSGGNWLDAARGVALGARRLSILDRSSAGDQPLVSADGRYVVVMNGEIYNFPELRAEIEIPRGGRSWRGHSDTEVLAEAIALWGVEKAISRTNGMFALAVWDRLECELWLARDRVGKKPVYYGWAGNTIVFASELKALCQHPKFNPTISVDALAGYMQLGYVLGEQAIFAGVKRLPAGNLLRIGRRVSRGDVLSPRPYWRLRDVALAGLEAQASGQIPDDEELAGLLEDAVARRMIADVPVGSLLSGGIDSSLVTALMRRRSPQQVRTFTIGFKAIGWNEAQHANAVAKHLGTHHEELYVSGADFRDTLREVPRICDEPFADDSIVPTILLSRMARQSVTVALSGDGGDELFVGYDRYAAIDRLLARRARIPMAVCALGGNLNDALIRPLAKRWGSTRLERRLALLGYLLRNGDAAGFSQLVMSQHNVSKLLDVPCQDHLLLSDPVLNIDRSTAIDRMTFLDTMSYLVDDILFKMDRASMSTSLEVRCPLLDHRVIEFSWRYPSATKLSETMGKLPLRKILYQLVPRPLVERPKMGFSAPVAMWLKEELRDWAEALMTRERLADTGLLNVAACRKAWDDFASRGRGWSPALWYILMFQAWQQEMRSIRRPPGAFAGSLEGGRALKYSSAR